jgi:hypothetical protein
MLIAARTGVMTWLNTDGGGGTVLDGFPSSVKESLTAIAADPTPGLLLVAVLSVVGIILGAIVWVIVWVSGQWVPLVVALLVLQSAGLAAPGMPRKWLSRGFSVLWTLLLTPVMVIIIWRVGKIGLESNTGYLGLLGGVLILSACAFSFLIVQRMLPMGEGTGLGIGAALMTAGSWVAGRASTAGRAGPSRQQLAQQQMHHSSTGTPGGSGSGGTGNPGSGSSTGNPGTGTRSGSSGPGTPGGTGTGGSGSGGSSGTGNSGTGKPGGGTGNPGGAGSNAGGSSGSGLPDPRSPTPPTTPPDADDNGSPAAPDVSPLGPDATDPRSGPP